MDTYTLLSSLLAVVFAWAGCLNFFMPAFVRQEYENWRYPVWLGRLVGIAEWLTAAALITQFYPRAGLALGLMVLLGVIATLAKSSQWMRIEYPLVLAAASLIVWQLSPAIGFFGI